MDTNPISNPPTPAAPRNVLPQKTGPFKIISDSSDPKATGRLKDTFEKIKKVLYTFDEFFLKQLLDDVKLLRIRVHKHIENQKTRSLASKVNAFFKKLWVSYRFNSLEKELQARIKIISWEPHPEFTIAKKIELVKFIDKSLAQDNSDEALYFGEKKLAELPKSVLREMLFLAIDHECENVAKFLIEKNLVLIDTPLISMTTAPPQNTPMSREQRKQMLSLSVAGLAIRKRNETILKLALKCANHQYILNSDMEILQELNDQFNKDNKNISKILEDAKRLSSLKKPINS